MECGHLPTEVKKQFAARTLPKCLSTRGAYEFSKSKKEEMTCGNCNEEYPTSYRKCLYSAIPNTKEFILFPTNITLPNGASQKVKHSFAAKGSN